MMYLYREPIRMEEGKLGKCISEPLCCPDAMMQPLTIKTEQAKRACNTCLTNSPKKVCNSVLEHPHAPLVCSTLGFLSILASWLQVIHTDGGCSRTNPVTWVGVAGQNVQVQVKREPQHMHVSELVAVKLEQASPGNKPDPPPAIPASLNNGELLPLIWSWLT